MKQVMFIEVGMGIDLHGQDVTCAAVRACREAIGHNSMPGIRTVLPEGDIHQMQVRVTLALPTGKDELDADAVKQVFPYGQVELRVVEGGLLASSGVLLPEQGDKTDEMIIAIAVVEAGY